MELVQLALSEEPQRAGDLRSTPRLLVFILLLP